jgi:hypothetical protein
MRKARINLTIIKEDEGYSAYTHVQSKFIGTQGNSLEELKSNLLDAVNLALKEDGVIYYLEDLKLTLDIESFFAFYRVINAKALSVKIGMNQSLLAQYISGNKKPSPMQLKRIMNGVQQIGRELAEIKIVHDSGFPAKPFPDRM